jgi:hypothetical protein
LVIFQNPALSDDSLRAVVHTVLTAPDYQWTDPSTRLSLLARWWAAVGDWLNRLQQSNPLAMELLLWGLVAVLVAIFVHGGWIMYQTVHRAGAPPSEGSTEALSSIRDERWYQRRAEELAAQGRFAEAMQAAFTALMLHLDTRGILRFHPSKTPREYAREAKLGEDLRAILAGAVGTLYACAYAGRVCGADQYREWLLVLKREWHARPH